MRVTVAFYGRQLELNRETLVSLGQLPEARRQSFQPGSCFRISLSLGPAFFLERTTAWDAGRFFKAHSVRVPNVI
jgi:hypothetical protein